MKALIKHATARAAELSDNGQQHIIVANTGRRKTVCVMAILSACGISPDSYRFGDCLHDCTRLLRKNGWSVQQRKVKKGITVDKIRATVAALDESAFYYLVYVNGHVLLMDANGATVVDSDYREHFDRRKVLELHRIIQK